MAKANILIVEDNLIVAEDIKNSLNSLGYSVSDIVSYGEKVIKKVEENKPDLVLMDIMLKGEMDGIEAAEQIHSRFNIPVVYLTAYTDEKLLERAKITEPFGYIVKPFEERELNTVIKIALYKHRAEEALKRAHDELEERVKERTAELTHAYEDLQAEGKERKRAEEALKKSEFWLSNIYNSLEEAVLVVSPDRNLKDVNKAAEKMFGYSKDELLGHSTEILHLDYAHYMEFGQRIKDAFNRGETASFEFEAKRKSGELFPTEHAVSLLKDDSGNALGIVSMVRDITDRKQAKEALQRAHDELEERVIERTAALEGVNNELRREIADRRLTEERLCSLEKALETTNMGVSITDLKGKIIYTNPADARMHGYSKEELIGKDVRIFAPLEIHDEVSIDKILTTRDRKRESLNIRKDGATFPVNLISDIVTDPSGEPVAIVTTCEDITERKNAEESLRKLLRAVEQSPTSIIVTDTDGNMEYVNPKFSEITGYSSNEAIGQNPRILNSGEQSSEFYEELWKSITSGHEWRGELLNKKKNGELFWEQASIAPVFDEKGKITNFLAVKEDITERKKTEKALRTTEERYALAMEVANDGIWDRDIETGDTYFSPRWKKLLGYENHELSNRQEEWEKRIHPDDHDKVMEDMANYFNGNAPYYFSEYRLRHKDGSYHWVMAKGAIVRNEDGHATRFVGSHTDITDRKKVEEERKSLEVQLQHSQKMETIGTLAGGIAHDFNNILTPIMNYTFLALEGLPEDGYAREDLENVMKAADRAKELVQQILTLSRQDEATSQHVQVSVIIEETLKLIRPLLPSTIEIQQKVDDCGYVWADPARIHQVLMNLYTNASHSMRDEGGRLEVSAGVTEIDDESAKKYLNLQPGKHVMISVSDTGHGMDDVIVERIFDPFFTTKCVGEGTGLGLSVVHGIILNLGGEITVDSEPGKGTTFKVYIPSSDNNEVQVTTRESGEVPVGKEKILFVDDEKAIVSLGEAMLGRLGYEVTARSSSLEALEEFRADPEKFDLIISDYTMPKMTGVQLARKLIAIRSDIPIILTSGFNDKVTPENFHEFGIHEYIVKPFTSSCLGNAIRRVLDKVNSSKG